MSQSFLQHPDEFRPRRYASHGCGSVFGRGRSILFLVSVFLGMLGLVSPSHKQQTGGLEIQDPPVAPHQLATAYSPLQLLPAEPGTATPLVVEPTELHRLVAVHGGALSDSRVSLVRSVGQRLVNASGLESLHVRFDVLADSTRAVAYTLSSGNLLVTAGVVDRLPAQHKIAGVLARQLEQLLASRRTIPSGVAAQLLTNAGFESSSLWAIDQQLASWRSEAGAQTVLASHVAPL